LPLSSPIVGQECPGVQWCCASLAKIPSRPSMR
jgi:hypothetical protein